MYFMLKKFELSRKWVVKNPEFLGKTFWFILWGVLIYLTWEMTNSLFLVTVFKLTEILFRDEIFFEGIAYNFKRIAWNVLAFTAFMLAFSLNHSGFLQVGVYVMAYMLVAEAILYKLGSFNSTLETA